MAEYSYDSGCEGLYCLPPKGEAPMTATIPGISGTLTLNLQQQLARVIGKWATQQGIQRSAIDGVNLIRSDQPSSCGSSVYEASLSFVIQGTKTIQLGESEITYKPLASLASSVYLPVMRRVIDASEVYH